MTAKYIGQMYFFDLFDIIFSYAWDFENEVFIQQPDDLVQGGEEDGIDLLPHHPEAEPMELGLARLACQVLSQGDDRRRRDRGAVRPQRREHVGYRNDADSAAERGLQARYGGRRLAQPVHRHDRLFEPAAGEPLRDGHLLRHAHLVQFDPRARELFHRLDEVPRVGPQAGVVQGDAQVPRLAREAGNPLHLLPSTGRILARVRVTARQDDGVPSIVPHEGTDGLHAPCKDVFHGMIIDSFHKYRYICRELKRKTP